MKYHQTKNEAYSLIQMQASTDIFLAKLSIDIHTSRTQNDAAVHYMYPEALLSGCSDMNREAFLDALSKLGAVLDIKMKYGRLEITLKCLSENVKKSLQLLAVMLQKPTFRIKEIDRIRQLSENELNEYIEQARCRAQDTLENILYKKQDRRAHPSIKTVRTELHKVDKNDFVQKHKQVLSSHWNITVAGKKEILALAEKTITGIQKSVVVQKPIHVPNTDVTSQVDLLAIPSKTNIEFSIGGPLPITISHPDYSALFFGLSVLGKWGGFTGRLMSTVREKEGLTYSIYARAETEHNTELGYWRIMTFFSPAQSVQGVTSTLRELRSIVKKGITPSELKRFKSILRTRHALVGDSLVETAGLYHSLQVIDFDPQDYEALYKEIDTMTVARVNNALRKHIDLNKIVVAGAGPVKSVTSDLQKLLK